MATPAKPPLKKFQKPPEDTPVIPSLSSRMNIELMLNSDGKAMILHREILPEVIWWAEYDVELNSLYFVTIKGQLMGYGMKLTKYLADMIIKATDLWFMHVPKEGDKGLPQPVPLVVRHPRPLNEAIAEADAEYEQNGMEL